MDDNKMKDPLKDLSELRFTAEDRKKVFDRIKKIDDDEPVKKNPFFSFPKPFFMATASLLAVGLFLFLLVPSVLQGDFGAEHAAGGDDKGAVLHDESQVITTLFTVKDENNRIPLNLLFAYHKEANLVKVLSLPRDTYSPISEKEDGTVFYDKLTHAYETGTGGAEQVKHTVSELMGITVDHHAVMDLDTLSTMIDSVDGISYDLQEDIQVRAISRVSFEFEKGTNRLNGEEVVALMMAATVGQLGEEDLMNLIQAVINQTINALPQQQLKQYTSKLGGNTPTDHLLESKEEHPSIQVVPLYEGMINERIEGAFYIRFEQGFLEKVSEEMTEFELK
ncbi:LCP family protein [Bhargavaea ginsengi]|uniref:LCP family protein n=1 Tax=Bhargavaea ginsengi TaxID=426757 RepID=UPI003C70B903